MNLKLLKDLELSQERLKIQTTKETLPNIGWHEIKLEKKDLYSEIYQMMNFVFILHIVAFNVKDKLMVSSTINYGQKIPVS